MQKITWDNVSSIQAYVLKHGQDGLWRGRMNAKQQRATIGVYLGKGLLVLSLRTSCVLHFVTVAFGYDWHVSKEINLNTLAVQAND